jgi:hypothetical protein
LELLDAIYAKYGDAGRFDANIVVLPPPFMPPMSNTFFPSAG